MTTTTATMQQLRKLCHLTTAAKSHKRTVLKWYSIQCMGYAEKCGKPSSLLSALL
jgi:hypothetical protein